MAVIISRRSSCRPNFATAPAETGFSRATVARHVAALKGAGEWPEL